MIYVHTFALFPSLIIVPLGRTTNGERQTAKILLMTAKNSIQESEYRWPNLVSSSDFPEVSPA